MAGIQQMTVRSLTIGPDTTVALQSCRTLLVQQDCTRCDDDVPYLSQTQAEVNILHAVIESSVETADGTMRGDPYKQAGSGCCWNESHLRPRTWRRSSIEVNRRR
jgi:hypothetical protein